MIPESLGNSIAILPPGIVCDKCNNYFSQNVEKPFLESEEIKLLRFYQSIPSKKGRIPPIQAVMAPNFPATLFRPKSDTCDGIVDLGPEAIQHLMSAKKGTLFVPITGMEPEHYVVSRFLAKVAVEALAERLMKIDGGLDYLTDEVQFDPIRRFAREGYPRVWSHYARRIYDANRKLETEGGQSLQTIWEYDFLQTKHREWYFVLALFGLELTINLGGDSIEGYKIWLKEHNQSSPLYLDKKQIY